MNRANSTLAIVICTYNRNELLEQCLDSLLLQNSVDKAWSVIVVNNHPTPLPQNICYMIDQFQDGQKMDVLQAGLSIARNAAINRTDSQWLAFLDDDARVPDDYIAKVFSIIKEADFDCFGGGIRSWWYYGRPKWLDENYGSKPDLRSSKGLINEGYNWGSNIVIKKSALVNVDGFPEYIGMKGDHIGYSAENIVQINLRKQGYRIGYDPDLYINHVVAKPKLKLAWHISAAYATGRDGKSVFPEQYGIIGMLKSAKQCVTRPVKGFYKWITNRNYPFQKLYLDFLIPLALLLGKGRSLI